MTTVTSRDGTSIAYLREGNGPPVVLVGGGLDDGSENAALVPELAQRFTVLNYARRGRAESGDTAPYSAQRPPVSPSIGSRCTKSPIKPTKCSDSGRITSPG